MIKLRIDGKDICELSDEQLGATLQQITRELAYRMHTLISEISEQIDRAGSELRGD